MHAIHKLTTLLAAMALAGCSTLHATYGNGDGNGGFEAQNDIEQQMAADSQGGDQ